MNCARCSRPAVLALACVVAALLRCGLAQDPNAISDLPFLDRTTAKELIVFTTPPPGYEPATTDAEWEPVLRANLHDDLAKYRAKIAKAGRPFSLLQLGNQLAAQWRTSARARVALVVVRGNKLYKAIDSSAGHMVRIRIQRILRTLAGAVHQYGLQLPDTVFALNTFDEPVCRLTRGCRVPVFSMHKRYNFTSNRSIDSDVLFPHLAHPFDRLIFYPWAAKDKHAVLRASMQSSMDNDCMRVQLAKLSSSPAGAPYLDSGFIQNDKSSWDMPPQYKRPYLGMSKHAKYKFVVNADGHVSASRLGYIMQTNSVVLRQQSKWIEYYYRSLRHREHVLEYDAASILPMLKSYDDPARDAELRRIANSSQHFCARYLTPEGKARYAVYALRAYAELFSPALPAFVRGLSGLLPSRTGGSNSTGNVPNGDELVRALISASESEPESAA